MYSGSYLLGASYYTFKGFFHSGLFGFLAKFSDHGGASLKKHSVGFWNMHFTLLSVFVIVGKALPCNCD